MIYADASFVFGLIDPDDALAQQAREVYAEHGDDIALPLATTIELFVVAYPEADDYTAIADSLDDALNLDYQRSILYTGAALIDEGHTPFDAFHSAIAECESDYDTILTFDEGFPELVPHLDRRDSS